ncbi:hypothetical protein [Moraxella oblonga]|uniref:hypothetical protein n=1 Tax=Moraxella oblonga TaxID=200413 RepID=UPI00082EA67C|nr:hypothetical protein [Moraxella oblonga]
MTTHHTQKQLHANKKHTKLGKLGAYLGAVYASDKSYQAVDVGLTFDKKFVSAQAHQFAKELLGKRIYGACTLAQKILPTKMLVHWSDEVYDKVATWTHNWALLRLQKDERFANLANLTRQERDEFVDDIINQNRTWLSLGGAFGVFGLKGVVLESAWLLVMLLRTVYELAYIYGVDVSGKDGVRTAHAVVASVDETLIGQKQILLTTLTIGRMVLKNAQTTGLANELLALSTNPLTKQYGDYLDEVLGWFDMEKSDLDKFNSAWLYHLCSVASVGASVHYNNQIFENVVGVAKATFGQVGEIKLLENA